MCTKRSTCFISLNHSGAAAQRTVPSPLIGRTQMSPNEIVSCEVQTLLGGLSTAVDKLNKVPVKQQWMSVLSRGNRISHIRPFNFWVLKIQKWLYLWFNTLRDRERKPGVHQALWQTVEHFPECCLVVTLNSKVKRCGGGRTSFFLKSTIQRGEADGMNRSEFYNFSKAICLNGDPTKPAWPLTCDHCSLKSELHILCAF